MMLIPGIPDVRRAIADHGFAWLPRAAWALSAQLEPHWHRLCADWGHLEHDRYLAGSARFRLRRYGRFHWSPGPSALRAVPNEPYFQPKEENAYAGGVARVFASLLPETMDNPFLHALVRATFDCLPLPGEKRGGIWEVRIHQIRIVAEPNEPGLPTPEGIHQDGTDFLTLHLVQRQNVEGAESTIYDLERRPIRHLTLREPLDSMILEDPRIMHGVTPVHCADRRTPATRDLLGVDFIYRPDWDPPPARA